MIINRSQAFAFVLILAASRFGFADLRTCVDYLNRGANATTIDERIDLNSKALAEWRSGFDGRIKGKALYNRGSAYLMKEDFDRAAEDLEAAVPLDSGNRNAWANRGVARLKKHRLQDALDDFNHAIAMPKSDAWEYNAGTGVVDKLDDNRGVHADNSNSLAGAWSGRALVYEEMGKADLALADFATAIEKDPQDAHTYQSRGRLLHKLKRNDEAEKDFNKALELDATLIVARMLRATFKAGRYDFKGAMEDMAKVVEIKPGDGAMREIYGSYASLAGESEVAVAEMSKALDLGFERTASLLDQRGRAYYSLGKYPEALKDLLEAKQKDPKMLRLPYFLGETYRALKDFDNAAATLDAAIKEDPSDSELHVARGNLYDDQDKDEEALAEYVKAAEASPKWSKPMLLQAAVLDKLKKREEAVAAYGKAIELDETSALAYSLRAASQFSLKRYAEAAADYAKSIELGRADEGDLLGLGRALLGQGKGEEALAAFGKAVAVSPDANSLTLRGLAYVDLGKIAEGEVDFSKAVEIKPHKFAWCGRALAAWSKSDKPKALEYFAKAIELDKRFGTDLNWAAASVPLSPNLLKLLKEVSAAKK